jgi:hypothetical protein
MGGSRKIERGATLAPFGHRVAKDQSSGVHNQESRK